MKRYALAPRIGTGAEDDPYRPNLTGSWVLVAQVGNWCLVKTIVPDGTAMDAATIADMDDQESEIRFATLTAAQRTAIKSWLNARGFDISQFSADAPLDRAALLRFVLRRLAGLDLDWRTVLHGFDVTA